LYIQNPAISCILAFLNTLTVATLFPCVSTAFQQCERRSRAFPFEMTPERQQKFTHRRLSGDLTNS